MVTEREKKRLIFFFIAIILFPTLIILTRLFCLQFLQQERLREMANQNIKRDLFEEIRGTIYDRAGRELAVSIEVDSLYADPKKIASKEVTARRLSTILNIDPKDQKRLLSKLRGPRRFIWIKRKIDPEERAKIEALGMEGLGFIKEHKRIYPKGEMAAHLLGFVGLDNRGLEGVEAYFDQYLRGQTKSIEVLRDARGQVVRILSVKEEIPAFMGCDLILTIDEIIQHAAELELKKVVGAYRAEGGSIMVMDPASGEILAMATQPSFDPNCVRNFKSSDWRNRAIIDAFEPGSTLKPFVFAAAFEEGVIDPKEKVFCPGFIKIADHKICCHEKHGGLTLGEALEKSCNVGTIELALRLNPRRFYEHMRAFGFGNITGITLPGEGSGCLRKPSSWSGLSQASMSIGQEVLVSPLQLMVATSALANGGRVMEPMIVKEIRDQEGKTVKEFNPVCIRQAILGKNCKGLNDLLEGVVLRGTGQGAQLFGYHVYGKTGTAQKFDRDLGRYSEDKLVSLFTGWVELGGRKVSILVVIDEPKGIHWGSIVAVPAFKHVAQKILPYLGIFPEKTLLAQGQDSQELTPINPQIPTTGPGLVMPDVCGMAIRGVHQALSPYELRMAFEGSGIAVSQDPLPGTELKPGMVARIRFDGG